MARDSIRQTILARTGAAVGSRLPRCDVAAEIAEELRAAIPYEAMHVALVDPFSGAHRTLVNHGYDERIVRYVETDYSLRDPAFVDVIEARGPMRMRDVSFDYRSSFSYVNYWGPAGYGDGMATPLFAPDGRYVGIANISTDTEDVLTDDVRDFMALLAGAFGAMVDPLADVAAWIDEESGSRRVIVRSDGSLLERVGEGEATPEVARDVLIAVAQAMAASPLRARQGLVADPNGRLASIQLMRTHSARLADDPVVLLTLRDAGRVDLTLRETEVLRHLVDGVSNREIAETLGVAPRTIATHVEHLLRKLGVETRTAAVAQAIERGMVRLDMGAPS